MIADMIEYFGIHYNPIGAKKFFALKSDKPFVIEREADKVRFWGYNTLKEALLAKNPNENIFQFSNHAWHQILPAAIN